MGWVLGECWEFVRGGGHLLGQEQLRGRDYGITHTANQGLQRAEIRDMLAASLEASPSISMHGACDAQRTSYYTV